MFEDSLGEMRDRLAALLTQLSAASDLDLADLARVVGATQEVANAAQAAQCLALARIAAAEQRWAEDGTLVEDTRPLGHVRADVGGLVSAELGVSDAVAERRARHAAALCARMPLVVDAMSAGRIDQFRAQVIAEETADCADDVAAVVDAALAPALGEDSAGPLRSRVRRLVARIDPVSLRQAAARVREGRYVRRARFSPGPGAIGWEAVLPAEEALTAWAAIDTLARTYRDQGLAETLDQARADAMMDLITGRARTDVQIVLGVPAVAVTDPTDVADPHGLAPVSGTGTEVARSWLHDLVRAATSAPMAPAAGTMAAPAAPAEVTTAAATTATMAMTTGPGTATRTGPATATATKEATSAARSRRPALTPASVGLSALPCDTATGAPIAQPQRADRALVQTTSRAGTGSPAYRPPAALRRLVALRDGHCRFPGCTRAAVHCDIDHTVPWPGGPTALPNLALLCRRHHRVKQDPGWQVRLLPDGTALWTSPTGRRHRTDPVDHLHLDRYPDTVRATMVPATLVPATLVPATLSPTDPTGSADGPVGPAPSVPSVERVRAGRRRPASALEDLLERSCRSARRRRHRQDLTDRRAGRPTAVTDRHGRVAGEPRSEPVRTDVVLLVDPSGLAHVVAGSPPAGGGPAVGPPPF